MDEDASMSASVASTSASPAACASTAATGTESDSSTAPTPQAESQTPASLAISKKAPLVGKRRKLPSCDSCRLRRVLCVPVPPPGSCSRCLDKGIMQKPTGRTGRRIEQARATFGAMETSSLHSAPVADSHAWRTTQTSSTPLSQPSIPSSSRKVLLLPSVSTKDLDSRLAQTQLSGELVAHLLGLWQELPQSWLSVIPQARLMSAFEESGRRLSALPPQAEVLAYTIMALTSRLSSHPYILGDGPPAPAFEAFTSQSLKERPDLQAFGARRDAVCEKMQVKAVQLAWERGTLVEASEETMASCHLLDILESRTDTKKGMPYVSAFVTHLRTLLDERDTVGGGVTGLMKHPGWSALMMRESLSALRMGRRSHFVDADNDALLLSPTPLSIEVMFRHIQNGVGRDPMTTFYGFTNSYMSHVAKMARECSEHVAGSWVRNRPLDEMFVANYLSQLDLLDHLQHSILGLIPLSLTPEATRARAYSHDAETKSRYIMTLCSHTLRFAWAGLVLPLSIELRRRLSLMDVTAMTAEKRRTRDRLQVLKGHAQRALMKAARGVAACVDTPASLAYLTHIQHERIDIWADVLLDLAHEDGISREDRISDLQTVSSRDVFRCSLCAGCSYVVCPYQILAGLKMIGWSWPDNAELITSLEERLQTMRMEDSPPARTEVSTPNNTQQGIEAQTPAVLAQEDLGLFSQYLAMPLPSTLNTAPNSLAFSSDAMSHAFSSNEMNASSTHLSTLPTNVGLGGSAAHLDPAQWSTFGTEFTQMLDEGSRLSALDSSWV
ncbi:BQ5605_C009g05796 [Microbotryum silenes-dioicae]|uniref:BQ5605_C009g05796 protein n=1 Tax=Microbotryum silenes-dioicae TaxID=796604 RepID=A0A2X0N133_9BASI|nr:BQ5605_C009g05796 [Microbotryum silenes-dioicae]